VFSLIGEPWRLHLARLDACTTLAHFRSARALLFTPRSWAKVHDIRGARGRSAGVVAGLMRRVASGTHPRVPRRGVFSMQCAWCRRFIDADGCIVPAPTAAGASQVNHGICYACLDAMLRAEVDHHRRAGEVREALAAEGDRLRTYTRLIRARYVATRRRVTAIHERTREAVAQSRAIRETARRAR
jgi:hypothetical protein